MKRYEIKPNDELKINSEIISIDPSKVYNWNFQVKGIKGSDNSAYGLIIFTDGKMEYARRIRMIKNWSGQVTQNSIVSAVSSQAKFMRIGFRVNCQGAKPDHVIIELPSIDSHSIKEVPKDTLQSYDDLYNYENDWSRFNLDENWWSPVGGFKNEQAYNKNGILKVEILKYFGLKPDSSLLDIGCGTGILVKPLEKYLTTLENYTGTDIAQKAVDYCRKHYPIAKFYKNGMTQLPEMGKKFDMICLFSIFTHLYPEETLEYLKNIKKYLKSNGCIVATIFKNSKIFSYTGTRDKMQLNDNYFSDIAKRAGFSNIETQKDHKDNKQIAYKLN